MKHTMLWHLGLPENIKGSFGMGACPATAGAVILQSAQFMNCFQVFFGRHNGSQVVVLLRVLHQQVRNGVGGRTRPAHS